MSEIAQDEFEPLLTEAGRISVTVGSTFAWNGHTHWPKVSIEDGPLIALDDDGNATIEDTPDQIYRITETCHRVLAAVIARMKRDIDTRAEEDRAERNRKKQAFQTSS